MIIPLSLDCRNVRIVMVGAGKASLGKLQYLTRLLEDQLSATEADKNDRPDLVIISIASIPEIKEMLKNQSFASVTFHERPWKDDDLCQGDLVYAFTSDASLNQHIASLCQSRGILCNAAGQRSSGGFTSPASFVHGQNCISVASLEPGKANPRHSSYLAQYCQNILDRMENATEMEHLIPGPEHYMPLMVGLRKVLVLGSEHPEGKEKSGKLERFALQLTTMTESDLHLARGFRNPEELLTKTLPAYDFVCSACTDDALNSHIHELCGRYGIRHTVIDNKAYSDTWFMSVAGTGPLLAALSTRGQASITLPTMRQELESWVQTREGVVSLVRDLIQGELAPLSRAERSQKLAIVLSDEDCLALANQGELVKALARAKQILN